MGANSSSRENEREESGQAMATDRSAAGGAPSSQPTLLSLSPGLSLLVHPETGSVTTIRRGGGGGRVVETQQDDEETETEEEGEGEGEGEDGSESEFMEMTPMQLLARILRAHPSSTFDDPRLSAKYEKEVPLTQCEPMDPTSDVYQRILLDSEGTGQGSKNISHTVQKRQLLMDAPTPAQRVSTSLNMLPTHPTIADSFDSRVFCGIYSEDGSVFLAATQERKIHLYNTLGGSFKRYHSVEARDVGWSVLDVALSPDQNWFVYSTWSPYVHLCNVRGEEERHYSLDLRPEYDDRFCAFSVRFSNDNREIVASASEGYLFIYDREVCDRILQINAHADDMSAAVFADKSSQIIYSGGDDGICKVWDRRALSESSPTPVGMLAGHKDGITFIDPKGDGRHLITNSKDQSIKLWDVRKFSPQEGVQATFSHVEKQGWDYRYETVPRSTRQDATKKLTGDTSVMTYVGHWVKNTLLRCRFSPMETTGQRYIYTACAKGRVLIYDALTGEIVSNLIAPNCISPHHRRNCIRDVSWHPREPGTLVASTWNGLLQMWSYDQRPDYIDVDLDTPQRMFNWW